MNPLTIRRACALGLGLMAASAALADVTDISVGDASTEAANGNGATMRFNLSRSGDLDYPASVGYTTQDGSATAGPDYSARAGTVIFPEGIASAVVDVPVSGKTGDPPDLFFFLQLLQAGGAAPGPALGPRVQFSVGKKSPRELKAADFNGDGRPDLIVRSYDTVAKLDGLSILRNNGAPGAALDFAAGQFFPTSSDKSFALADFDLDGRVDIVQSDMLSNQLRLMRNTTAPGASTVTFDLSNHTLSPSSLISSGSRFTPAAGDFNGDGRPDLVVACHNSVGKLCVLVNQTLPGGAPTFSPTQMVGTSAEPISVGDLNGDGRPDWLAGRFANFNTTAPGAAMISVGNGQIMVSAGDESKLVDVNSDGRPDAVTRHSPNLRLAINNTAPGAATLSLAAERTISFPVNMSPNDVDAGDVNGDGRPDLLVEASGQTFFVMPNLTAPASGEPAFGRIDLRSANANPVAMISSDLNGDGRPDLVALDNSDSIYVTPGVAPALAVPYLTRARQGFAAGSGPRGLAAADVNGDGRPDLVTANVSSNDLSVLMSATPAGAGDAGFDAPQSLAVGNGPQSVAFSDLNGDGRPDLVAGNFSGGSVSVLLNTTTPGARAPSFAPQHPLAAGVSPRSVVPTDVNGDGRPDLVVANVNANTATVLINQTAPGATVPFFAAGQNFATGAGPFAVAAGDLNGDGRPDLIVANRDAATVSVLLNTTLPGGSPSFAPQQAFATQTGPNAAAVADVNGDGRPDLVVANITTSTVSVLLNTTALGASTPSLAPQQVFPTGSNPISVAAGDLDGDGRPDLIVANHGADTLSVLRNLTVPGGTPAFAPATHIAAGVDPRAAIFTDVNGDGRPDLAVADSGGSSVSVLLSRQYQANASATPGEGTIQYIAGIGSFVFDPLTNAPSQMDVFSNVITVEAPAGSFPISISGNATAKYQKNGATFTNVAGTVQDGDTIRLRITSAQAAGGVVSATLDIGGKTGSWNVTTGTDTAPKAFSFVNQTDVPGGTVATSNSITVSGINAPAFVAVSGEPSAQFSINGGPFGTSGSVNNGNTVRLRMTAANTSTTARTATLNIGGVMANWTVTSGFVPDTTPDAFSFPPLNNAASNTNLGSNTIVVSGINTAAPISVSGHASAKYSINGGAFTNVAGNVSNGASVRLLLTSAQAAGGSVSATLNIGGTSGGWTVTTGTDTTPKPFSFTNLARVPAASLQTSNAVTINGINAPTAAAVSGDASARLTVNGGAPVTSAMVNNGDVVRLQLTSSASPGGSVAASLNVGGVTAGWTVTTGP